MDITVNGDVHACADGETISGLLRQLGIQGKRIAVEVNLDIVPRSLFDKTNLKTGDKVEIIHAIGGGAV